MSHHDERDLLTNELRQRSAGIGGHPIGLDDVRDRARSIRRRRNAVRGVVAAVVLAVAVPVGLSTTDLLGTGQDAPPPAASNTPNPSPSPSEPAPTPQADGSFPLTVHGLKQGAPAGIPYVDADATRLVTPDGAVDLPEAYSMITPYNGGWLAIGSSQHPGKVIMLDAGMNVTHTDPAGGSALAVSRDGTHVAYVVRESKNQVMLVNAPTDGTDPVTWQFELPDGETLDPVGFLDDDSVVYSSDTFETMGVARTGGETTPVVGLRRIDDASEATGLVTGLVSYGTDGGCSGVMDPQAGQLLWKSCDYSNLRFSPDGRYVVADASYFDGPGSPTLTVLDAVTGKVVVAFKPTARRTVVGVSQAAWESDDTVLAYVDEGGDQAMVRLRLDGSAERVTDVVTVNDMVVKYWFAETTRF
ncbi:MAG: hypothetical protein ACTHKG_03900 [Nocardioides sp.]